MTQENGWGVSGCRTLSWDFSIILSWSIPRLQAISADAGVHSAQAEDG